MNILFVTTVRHNPGDDFIRLGQQWLFSQCFENPTFSYVHKHDPRTLFQGFRKQSTSPHRLLAPILFHATKILDGCARDKIERADLVVFAGTPFIWRQRTALFPSTCANAEWVGTIWRQLWTGNQQVAVMNLAAGTSLSRADQRTTVLDDRDVKRFLERAMDRCVLTTARDQLTADILQDLAYDVPVLPCTSMWAADGASLSPEEPEYVAINVMPVGVHRSRGNTVNGEGWRKIATQVVEDVEKRHPVMFVCHSAEEYDVAQDWFPGRRAFFSLDAKDLLEVYSRALYGVTNRVHAAAAIASFRRPAIAVGGDTRVQLLQEFGLPYVDYRTSCAHEIIGMCHRIEENLDGIARDLTRRADDACRRYVALISQALRSQSYKSAREELTAAGLE